MKSFLLVAFLLFFFLHFFYIKKIHWDIKINGGINFKIQNLQVHITLIIQGIPARRGEGSKSTFFHYSAVNKTCSSYIHIFYFGGATLMKF